MDVLQDSIHIEAPPERVWRWVTEMADHYREWHPDHVSATWVKGAPNRVGSVLEAVEVLGGHKEVLRFELTGIEAPHRFEYRIRGPISIMLPRGWFLIEPEDGGSRFTAAIRCRFLRFLEWSMPTRTAGLRSHMREEGINLKRIIERTAQ